MATELFSASMLKAGMPEARQNNIRRYRQALIDACLEFDIRDRLPLACFLGTIAEESGQLNFVRELASGDAYNERADLGNTKPEAIEIAARHGSTPGPRWRGHGLIQVTGFDNHEWMGQHLHGDRMVFLDNPERLMQPDDAARSAAIFFRNAKLRDGTRVDLMRYAKLGDMWTVSLAVNRGLLESERSPLHWTKRKAFFEAFREALP